jgi:hypothetical protein
LGSAIKKKKVNFMWGLEYKFYMHHNVKLQELKNLLMMYKLINTVTSPTRITNNTIPLIDVIITNKQNHKISSTVLDLGYSDYQAQILHIYVNEP